jgi:ribosomal protein S27E
MTDMPAQAQFACCECGSPSIIFPAAIADEAAVSCGGCRRVISSWLGYKSFVSRSIGLEATGARSAASICADPIIALPLKELLAGL